MPTYTTTADPVTGVFKIDLPAALVSGEKVKVTAQKNGQTRSLNLQAPSEPYLPPSSGGNVSNEIRFPLSFDYAQSILAGSAVIYKDKGCTEEVVGNERILTNQYFKPQQAIHAISVFKLPIAEFKQFEAEDNVLKLNIGYLSTSGEIVYPREGDWFTKQDIFDDNPRHGRFLLDDEYLYLLMSTMIMYDQVTNVDYGNSNTYQVTYKDQVYTYRLNRNYVESN